MSRQIPADRPLSDEDRAYLIQIGRVSLVEQIDEDFPGDDGGSKDEGDDEGGEGDDLSDLSDLSNAELVERLKDLNLPTSGKKKELVARLQKHFSGGDE